MNSNVIPFLTLSTCVVLIYIMSKQTLNRLSALLYRVFHHQSIVYSIIAVLYFPGTVLHEMAHFLAALLLLLRVKHVSLIPQWHADGIRLGSVTYIKRDVVRSVLVGIAPVWMGIAVLYVFSAINLFPAPTAWGNAAAIYLILVTSSTMFSSRQDLVDVLYVVPILMAVAVVAYLVRGQVTVIAAHVFNTRIFGSLLYHVNRMNTMLLITIAIHIMTNLVMALLLWLLRPRHHR